MNKPARKFCAAKSVREEHRFGFRRRHAAHCGPGLPAGGACPGTRSCGVTDSRSRGAAGSLERIRIADRFFSVSGLSSTEERPAKKASGRAEAVAVDAGVL